MAERVVTVFGGTGFLGRRVVRCLLDEGRTVRVATRHPDKTARLFGEIPQVQAVEADLRQPEATATAVQGADAVVNAVSLYVEHGTVTFHSVHVEGAARLARLARAADVERLVQISGIGADAGSDSPYIRSRGEGEAAVRQGFSDATIVRPAVMVGEDDALVVPLAAMLRRAPVFPLFGRGETRLQPAAVSDVATAVVRLIREEPDPPSQLFELGGAEVLSFRALVEAICRQIGRHPLLLPVPFAGWQGLALLAEQLPGAPLTRNQVALMRHDNTASGKLPGFTELGIEPQGVRDLLPRILGPSR